MRHDVEGNLTSEQQEYLRQRRQDVQVELQQLASGKTHPNYVDVTERAQELRDELTEIANLLGEEA